jgi:hypothetical protein
MLMQMEDEDMDISEGWKHRDRGGDMEDELQRVARKSTNLRQKTEAKGR